MNLLAFSDRPKPVQVYIFPYSPSLRLIEYYEENKEERKVGKGESVGSAWRFYIIKYELNIVQDYPYRGFRKWEEFSPRPICQRLLR